MILMSINPKWCEKIASGEKTVEIRTKKPKCPERLKGTKVYVYCTYNKGVLIPAYNDAQERVKLIYIEKASASFEQYRDECYNRQVIGEFSLGEIEEFDKFETGKRITIADRHKLCDKTCVPFGKVEKYADGKKIYLWHIDDFKLYDEPRPLEDYLIVGNCKEDCNFCKYQRSEIRNDKWYNWCSIPDHYARLTKPPMSWCYANYYDGQCLWD